MGHPFRKVLQAVFVLAVFGFLGGMVWENWNQVKEANFTVRILPLVFSTLIFAFSYFIQLWAWHLITLKLGIALPFKETLESWFYSQMGKYLPGKIWLLLSRFYLYDAKGKSKKAITVALYFETVMMITAAALLFLASLFFLKEVRLPFPGEGAFLLVPILALAFLCLHPWVLQKIFNRVLTGLKKEPLSLSLSYAQVLWILGICFASWVVGGIGFSLFVDSVFPVASRYFPFLTGALAVSSIAGLLALFAPGGLGVREGVLVFLLSLMMPGAVAAILSVLTRLWMTFIEIGLIGVVYLVGRFRKKE